LKYFSYFEINDDVDRIISSFGKRLIALPRVFFCFSNFFYRDVESRGLDLKEGYNSDDEESSVSEDNALDIDDFIQNEC